MSARTMHALIATLAFAASGCAGASHAVPAARAGATAARTTVSFVMRWPARAQSAARKPRFVSPSASSVVIEVNPDAAAVGPVTFANAPAGGGTATIAIEAPAGADVFVISLYDQPQTAGETSAAGTELGRVRVAQTITANATNTLSATVIGTVAAIRIGPMPNQSGVAPIAGSNPAAYELIGRDPATFTVAPLDAGGNVILQPEAPPSIALGPNPRSTGILSVTPVSGTTDQFTVQAIAVNATTYPTALSATATDANGNVATSSAIVDATSAVYVAYANGGSPAVARFDSRGAPLTLPAGAFAGLGNPVALAYDPDDREIFVADAGIGKVLAFDERGAPVASFAAPAVAGASGVAYDPHNGNVYATGTAGATVFSPSGGAPNGGVPASFAVASAAGIAYVATSASSVLNRIAVGSASATPSLRFFSESGSGAGSVTLPAAPIGVAYSAPALPGQVPQTTAQIYVTTAGGVLAFDAFGTSVATAADTGSPFGIAVDPNLGQPLVAERGANALTGYLDDLSAADPARTFNTPASLGLTQPQGVCHVF